MARHVDAARTQELVVYDPETGVFNWRIKRRGCRKSIGTMDRCGYLRITIDGNPFMAHRLAWVIMTGGQPPEFIDHANGNPADNRWSNLRIATAAENQRNSKRPKSNRSGAKGVSFVTRANCYQAQICVDGRTIYLGRFGTLPDASAAYAKASNQYHGQFSRIS